MFIRQGRNVLLLSVALWSFLLGLSLLTDLRLLGDGGSSVRGLKGSGLSSGSGSFLVGRHYRIDVEWQTGKGRMEEGDEVLSMVVVFLTQEGNIGASRYYVMARDLTRMLLTDTQNINKDLVRVSVATCIRRDFPTRSGI